MVYTKDNLKVCLAAPFEFFVQWRDELAADGFRPISISLAGPASEPIYTAVMARYAQPFRSQSWPALTRTELESKIAELKSADRPLHPYLVAATGSGSGVVYAVSFREMARESECDPSMTEAQYLAKCEAQREVNRMPIWVDAFGTAGQIRYCAIWGDNPAHIGWGVQSTNDKGAQRQERYDALALVGARPAHAAITPDGGLARIYVDTKLKHSSHSSADMSADRMQAVMDEQAAAGRFPVCIATAVLNDAVRYSALFAKSDEIVPRTFRVRGPAPSVASDGDGTKAAELDAWMEAYTRAHGARNAALAIVEGTRLVYARAFTYAEPDYPDAEPTTLFRLASASKVFCALAVWKALADDPDHGRGSTMQSILHLKKSDNTTPTGNFANIKIRHLLESCSGIKQGSMRGAMADIKAKKVQGTQPASVAVLASRVADTDTETDAPGGATHYGKTDYWLLGLVAAKLSGTPDFDAALRKLVLEPLHMTRTRTSSSRFESRPADEVIYHLANIVTAESAIDDNHRVVPAQYGDENYAVFDGAGGISSAVVDVARLCAVFSCTNGTPLFSQTTLNDMLTDAIAACDAGTDQGYHGFDIARGPLPHVYLSKGGILPGGVAGIRSTTGQLSFVLFRNGDAKPNAQPSDWEGSLSAIARDINWAGNLFPDFDMPPL